VEDPDAESFWKFFRAMVCLDYAKYNEDLVRLLRRRALVDPNTAHRDLISLLQTASVGGSLGLRHGQIAGAEVRTCLYSMICPDTEERKRIQNMLKHSKDSAYPFTKFCQRSGIDGSFTMLPTIVDERDLQHHDRMPDLPNGLYIIRPDLAGLLQLDSDMDKTSNGESDIGSRIAGGFRLQLSV
jgi:hypothetical protein